MFRVDFYKFEESSTFLRDIELQIEKFEPAYEARH